MRSRTVAVFVGLAMYLVMGAELMKVNKTTVYETLGGKGHHQLTLAGPIRDRSGGDFNTTNVSDGHLIRGKVLCDQDMPERQRKRAHQR